MTSVSSDTNVNHDQVMAALDTVKEPELGGTLVSRNMIKDVQIDGGRVAFTIELTTPACPLKEQMQTEAEAAVRKIAGVEEVAIEFTSAVRAYSGGGLPEQAAIPGVANVVAVAAGKGGVGKSTVAVNLAIALAQEGARVGLLDADIFGPSLPLMLGITGQPEAYETPGGEAVILPHQVYGVKIMSVGFMIDDSQPVIWRGPMASQLLRQFLYNVDWAPLDYLVVDMPPGTSDIPLTLAQALPLSGAVMVTTPQAVATLDVIKAVQMFKKVNVPILGIVENMAYFIAPDTGTRYDIFGSGGAARMAEQLDVPLFGQIPIGMSVREGGDRGVPAVAAEGADTHAEIFRATARQLAARISVLACG